MSRDLSRVARRVCPLFPTRPDPYLKLRGLPVMQERRDRARLRGLVDHHAAEVDGMIDRLATAHSAATLDAAIAAVLAAGHRYTFASQLETALLTRLGTNRATHTDSSGQRLDARRERRARGLACPQCYDSGWTVDDELTATRCDCTPNRAPSDTPPAVIDFDAVRRRLKRRSEDDQ